MPRLIPFSIRFTPEEDYTYRQLASAQNLTITEWVRQALRAKKESEKVKLTPRQVLMLAEILEHQKGDDEKLSSLITEIKTKAEKLQNNQR